jgi:SAM-dependent methyltransferase
MSEKNKHPSEDRSNVAARFNPSHSARLESQTLERIWATAYGKDYPDEAKPNAFYSRSTLLRLRAGLRIGPGATIADLGCGNGGAGLWIARELGANLIGIDLSAGGVAAASERAKKLGLGGRAEFREGDITATGLPSASCDGAISLDVLCFVPDKTAAVNEVRRILCPGARFAFTTWDQEGYSTRLQAPQLADHRPLLTEAGFDIELYEEPPAWRQQQRAVLEGLLALEQELAAELERPTVDRFLGMARGMLGEMPDRRYVSAVARRR